MVLKARKAAKWPQTFYMVLIVSPDFEIILGGNLSR